MEVAKLTVEDRTASGTNNVRNLRDTGKIPMVLYGGGQDSISLQSDYADVKRHLDHHLRVFNLELGGKMQAGYLQHVQWDCLTDEPLHVDFRRIEMDEPLHMKIELTLLGHPRGESRGSVLVRHVQSLELACLPAHVPESVELRIGNLDPAAKVFAKDIPLPEGCSLDMPGDFLVLHMTEVSEDAGEVDGSEGAPGGDEAPAPAGS